MRTQPTCRPPAPAAHTWKRAACLAPSIGPTSIGRALLLGTLIGATLFAVAAFGGVAADAAPLRPTAQGTAEPPTAERIAEARASAESDTSLDSAVRSQVLTLLETAQRALEAERASAQRLLELQQELAALPAQREAIVADMAQLIDTTVPVPADATLDRLRAERDEADANLRTAVERQASIERELAQNVERRAILPDEIATLTGALDDLAQEIATDPAPDRPAGPPASPPTGPPTGLAQARAWALAAQHAELSRRIALARAELSLIDARPEIDSLRLERAARRIAVREGALRQWQAIVAEATARQAELDAAEARRIAAEASPAERAVAERTVELLERRVDPIDGLVVRNRQWADHLARLDLRLTRLARQYEQDRQRVLDTGMAGLTTQRLRRQRSELPDMRTLTRGRGLLRQELAESQRELSDLEHERELLPSLLAQREEILANHPVDASDGTPAESAAASPSDSAYDLPPGQDDPQRITLIAELDRRLAARQRALDELIQAYRHREEMLLQMQDKLIPLVALTRAYIAFIDERILWIRSMDAINLGDVGSAWRVLAPNINPGALAAFGRSAVKAARADPLMPLLLAAAVALIPWLGVKVRRRRLALAELAARPHTDRTIHMAEATLIAVGSAAMVPAVIRAAAWMIGAIDGGSSLGPMIAGGLAYVAWVHFALRLVREITRPRGLGLAFYGWRPEACALLRRHLRWFGPIVLICAFLQGALEFEQSRAGTDPLARIATMALSASIGVLFVWLMGPRRGLFVDVVARGGAPWLERLLYLAYPVLIAIPMMLVVLDALGFSFTVNRFHAALFQTALFGIAVLLVGGLVTRWRLITRRRMAMEEARKRRAAAIAGDAGQAATADGDALAVDEAGLDVVAIDTQTRQLLRTGLAVMVVIGLFVIWSALLPALAMLERVELWPHPGSVRDASVAPPPLESVIGAHATASIRRSSTVSSGPVRVFTAAGAPLSSALPPDALSPAAPTNGAAEGNRLPDSTSAPSEPTARPGTGATPVSARGGTVLVPGMPAIGSDASSASDRTAEQSDGRVTLANLLAAALIAVLAILISRNIPGLLEIILLQRLPMTPSARYATTALTRYVIAVFGIFLSFGAIGIGWSQVQWLVAAITVGIGFGLQEIVANFISGVIILFEQPIRVGDTVTVGNVSGTVTKIRMRATTITDWDRKELLIPNKEFITGQVINWTLSDPTLRLVIPVGIAYGSDTAAAERLLRQAALDNPIVLRDPPPSVVFSRFGESSLDFELRAFLPTIEHLVRVRHELHNAIDRAFRAEGIEIAFPQRDIHVRDIAGRLQIGRGQRDEGPLPPDENPISN